MALLTRIAVGGAGQTYGAITDKAESAPPSAPADLLTRIAAGGVGKTYGTITDKSEGAGVSPRPGDLFTRIGVGGVGLTYTVTAKDETAVEELNRGGNAAFHAYVRRRHEVKGTREIYNALRKARTPCSDPR